MTTWKELKNDLSIDKENQNAIALEKDLIRTLVAIREEKGLTQSQLAEICNVKQPVIARMESAVHSPQIDSLLKILTPLGYTLQYRLTKIRSITNFKTDDLLSNNLMYQTVACYRIHPELFEAL